MGKLNHRALAVVLLVIWCTFLSLPNLNGQHRGVEFYTSDPGELVFLVIFIIITETGKKLDKGYRCPTYCEVKHKHIYRENQIIPEDTTKYFEKVLAFNR